MPRIIMKSPYIKPNSGGGKRAGNYARYIATREGVVLTEDTLKHLPATQKQEGLIQQILKDFPDSTDLHEYSDYRQNPTRENASEFISQALESHSGELAQREKYVSYIAERPGVEKLGKHGLFTDEGIPIVLEQVSREMAECKSNIWTHIISLRREDAARLGYDSAEDWINLLRSKRNVIAQQMRIKPENFRWYAAFHDAGHHPHVHLMAYSIDPKEAYLTEKGIEAIKGELAREIFRQDHISIYQKQTQYRDQLRQQGRESIAQIVEQINIGNFRNERVEELLRTLSTRLARTSGKKQYGYLKSDLKVIVDQIVMELAKDERIQTLYPAIIDRDRFNAVQAERERRNARKSPSQKTSTTGRSCYASKYALSERLVCGECGTLYRRCTWKRNGKTKIVWRCVNRLDYGTQYCHDSPSMEENSLQQAIMKALNSVMGTKHERMEQIKAAMIQEIFTASGEQVSLGDLNRRIQELEAEFSELLDKAPDTNMGDHMERFRAIKNELATLKEKREIISAQLRNNRTAQMKIWNTSMVLEKSNHHMTEWDEDDIRQLVHTVKVISEDRIKVILTDGTEINQEVHKQ